MHTYAYISSKIQVTHTYTYFLSQTSVNQFELESYI